MNKRPTLQDFTNSEWFKTRPPKIQEVAKNWPPGRYRLNGVAKNPHNGEVVLLYSYGENPDGTCDMVKVRLCCMCHKGSARIVDVCLNHLEPVDVLV